jgi:hypothetical protein
LFVSLNCAFFRPIAPAEAQSATPGLGMYRNRLHIGCIGTDAPLATTMPALPPDEIRWENPRFTMDLAVVNFFDHFKNPADLFCFIHRTNF